MRKDLKHLTDEQLLYLSNKIFKHLKNASSGCWSDSEICFTRIKSSLGVGKKNKPKNKGDNYE
jgi:hypothetical protein